MGTTTRSSCKEIPAQLNDRETMQLVLDTFGAAVEKLAEEKTEFNEMRQQLREMYGAREKSPFDFLLSGYCMGLLKGLQIADAARNPAEAE